MNFTAQLYVAGRIFCYYSQPPPKHSEISPHAALLLLSQLISSCVGGSFYEISVLGTVPYSLMCLTMSMANPDGEAINIDLEELVSEVLPSTALKP